MQLASGSNHKTLNFNRLITIFFSIITTHLSHLHRYVVTKQPHLKVGIKLNPTDELKLTLI